MAPLNGFMPYHTSKKEDSNSISPSMGTSNHYRFLNLQISPLNRSVT